MWNLTRLALLIIATIATIHAAKPEFDPLPGALVNVTFRSVVATRIPKMLGGTQPLPQYLVDLIIAKIEKPPRSYWRRKALAQTRLMLHRQIYRRYFYPNATSADPLLMRGQLTLPPERVWKFVIDPDHKGPQMYYRQGRQFVGVEYSFHSVIVARRGSIKRADPALAEINGTLIESWLLPMDPEFLMQRTGYSCMDETKGQFSSVVASNAWMFFNDYCKAKSDEAKLNDTGCLCHIKGESEQSCADTMRDRTGSKTVSVKWTRIEYSAKVAKDYRVGKPSPSVMRDLVNERSKSYRIFYKYFPASDCLTGPGGCIKKSGWRRLLAFKTSAYNAGYKRFLNIARIGSNPNATLFVENGVYRWNQCVNDFAHASFLKIAFGKTLGQPVTTCLHDSLRVLNHEYSPMATQYDTCQWQGISAGWAHQVNDGVPCNWIDITDTTPGEKQVLRSYVNPRGFVCEGVNVYTPRPKQPIFYGNDTVALPEPARRPACLRAEKYANNNVNRNRFAIGERMATVTMRCPVGVRPMTELRNCGWTMAKERLACSRGKNTTIIVKHGSHDWFDPVLNRTVYNNPTVAVRVCESSWALNQTSVRCEYAKALGHGLIVPFGYANITFKCPSKRDDVEVGGLASVMVAKFAAFENLGYPVPNVTISIAV